MPASLEIGAQLLEVVDLTVEDDLDRAVLVADRLVAALQVDDRQPSMHQSQARFHPEAFGVRPAMGNTLSHHLEDGVVHRLSRICIDDACDTAHGERTVCRSATSGSRY